MKGPPLNKVLDTTSLAVMANRLDSIAREMSNHGGANRSVDDHGGTRLFLLHRQFGT